MLYKMKIIYIRKNHSISLTFVQAIYSGQYICDTLNQEMLLAATGYLYTSIHVFFLLCIYKIKTFTVIHVTKNLYQHFKNTLLFTSCGS